MCGIAGIAYRDLEPQQAQLGVRKMIELLNHRGPDGQGYYDSRRVTLGHARLAIIDLSETGHQPMPDTEGRCWVIFNGEIYNYLELAKHLRSEGVSFRGTSDSEVLLASYLHWGTRCVEHFRGMFAFAIWDEQQQLLFAARDRLGIKPLHYWCDSKKNLYFASEIKSLLPFIPSRKLRHSLAKEYIAWNLLDHDSEQTFFKDVNRLPPGHILVWRPDEDLKIAPYWSLEKPQKGEQNPSNPGELFREFRERMEFIVHLHLRSDVPVGTSLSGGLDSSAIVGLVNLQLREQGVWREGWQHVFSACFEEPHLDERPYIQEVVKLTGVEPHFVFPSGDQLMTDMDAWIWHQEEPVGGTGTYAQYCVARLAHQHGIKVLLDGQGADEQLAGYRKFILVFLKELLREKAYFRVIKEAMAFFFSPEVLRTSRLIDGRRYLFNAPNHAHRLWPDGAFPDRPSSLKLGHSLQDRLHSDITQFSLPLLLRYEDRNSMAFGIEARVPFVDHEFVEWAIRLPSDMRLHHGWTKHILRESLADILPHKVKSRKTKLGFLTPEEKWLNGPLESWIKKTLSTPHYLEEIVDLQGVKHLLNQYNLGERTTALLNTLFRLAIFENWASQFLGSNQRFNLSSLEA